MWSDNETTVDLIGFQVHSDLIRSIVTNVDLLPVTVGVFGDWGSGKSSVMRMLERDLAARDDVGCIYFNGWQFEGYDDAKSALIHSILLELGEHKRLAPQIKSKVASLLARIDWLRLFNVGYQTVVAPVIAHQLAMMMGVPPTVPAPPMPIPEKSDLTDVDLTELVEKNPANRGVVGARQFRKDFESLVADTKLAALIILIDDLDRCEPGRLVETLEAIKLFLSVSRVAFVIGADQRIVRYAIAKRYETGRVEAEGLRTDRYVDLVTDYLEKLIQVPYHLPRLSPSEIETYMSLLFCQRHAPSAFKAVHKAFLDARRRSVSATFGYQQIKNLFEEQLFSFPEELDRALAWCSRIAPALSDVLKGNPRQTKRLLNAMLLRLALAGAAGLTVSDQILTKLMLLEYLRPELFGQLYRWQAAHPKGAPKQIEALEHGPEGEERRLAQLATEVLAQEPRWGSPEVETWLRMPPSLAGSDLRDYFWLTRDQITGILAGVSLIPPHIAKLLSSILDSEPGMLREAKRQASQLEPDEQEILLRELARDLRREPQQIGTRIGIWTDLADVVPMAPKWLVATLNDLPASSLSWEVPMLLVSLTQQCLAVQDSVKGLLDRWAKENTLISAPARDALKALVKFSGS
jgi:hypothetical protein